VSLKFDTDGRNNNTPIAKVILEREDGTKLWGTIPVAVFTKMGVTLNEGDSLVFKANITKSSDDPTFGFFKFGADLAHFGEQGITRTLPDGTFQFTSKLDETVFFADASDELPEPADEVDGFTEPF